MKRLLLCALLAAPGIFYATGASAELYFGAKTGPMLIDEGGFDDPINTSFTAGYQTGIVLGDLGVEGEISRTATNGETAGGEDVEVATEAVYVALRTAGPVYFKARTGLIRREVTVGSQSDDDTGGSVGLGIGFGLGILQIEIDYTQIDSDINYLTLGIQF